MAEFVNNELKDEERSGGFNPGTPDDETFFLETLDSYPGELPDYSNLEEEEKISLEEQLDLKENGNQAVEDSPMENTIEEPQSTLLEDESSVNLSVLEDSYEDAKESEGDVENANSVWDLFEENKSETPKPSAAVLGEEPDDEDMISDDELEKKMVSEPVTTKEEIELDDDFKQMIEFDLQKKKREPKKQEESTNISDDISDFHPVEEENSVKEFDLSKLDAEHPSTFHFEEEKVIDPFEAPAGDEPFVNFEPAAEPIIILADEKTKKEKKSEKEKPKKSKKRFIFYSAAIIILAAFGTVTYDWGVNRKGFEDFFGIWKKVQTEVVKDYIDKPKQIDSTDKTYDVKKQNAITKIEEKTQVDTAIMSEKELPVNEIKVEKPKHISQAKPTIITENKVKHLPPTYPKPEKVHVVNQEFTVQVYATPSKEDAEEWVRHLQSRNVKNVFISVQKKRDRDWFRVRFGSYNSMEDAKNAVKEIGLSQSWIDRVK